MCVLIFIFYGSSVPASNKVVCFTQVLVERLCFFMAVPCQQAVRLCALHGFMAVPCLKAMCLVRYKTSQGFGLKVCLMCSCTVVTGSY